MKKLFALLIVAIVLVACGPTKEEVAEKARLDSIAMADSIAKLDTVAKTDSTMVNDSIVVDTTSVK